MKTTLLLCSLILFFSLNAFAVETGRGQIYASNATSTSSATSIRISDFFKKTSFTFQIDSTLPVVLISGESIPFHTFTFKYNTTFNYQYEDTNLLSIAVDFSDYNGEYTLYGAIDVVDTTNQICRMNGMNFKVINPNTFNVIRSKLITSSFQSKSDLVRISYVPDSLSGDNIIRNFGITQGGYEDFKRTGIIRNLKFNEFYLGDPKDTNFRETFIIHFSTKIYDKNYNVITKSEVQPGALVEVYSYYDSIYSTNRVYELHVLELPSNDDVTIIGNGMSYNSNLFSNELGEFSISPSAQISNYHGDKITLSSLLDRSAANYSFCVTKKKDVNEIQSIKELPNLQLESTFEGNISIRDTVDATRYAFGFGGLFQYLEINKYKTFLNGIAFDDLDKKFARFTVRKGSRSNRYDSMKNDVLAIEKSSSTENIIIGLVTEIKNSQITINDITILLDSNSIFLNIDGESSSINDLKVGNYVVMDVQYAKNITAKTIYKFNPLEVIGRISNIQNEQITVGGFTFSTGDFTFYRGQGNQVTELDKILPNSVVKVVTLHGAAEAIEKFTGKTFPSNSATIARIVYVLQGPDPVSVNETVVTPTLYPNPSSTTVSITAPENIVSDVTVSTMLGERVFSKSNVTGTIQFSTATLPNGQYIVKITNNNGTSNQILQVIR